jgi:mannitol-1-phosphate/altronate dehydrogenase
MSSYLDQKWVNVKIAKFIKYVLKTHFKRKTEPLVVFNIQKVHKNNSNKKKNKIIKFSNFWNFYKFLNFIIHWENLMKKFTII